MLLFLFSSLLFAGDCKPETKYTPFFSTYEIIQCDKGLTEYIMYSKKYWEEKGYMFKFEEDKIYDCPNDENKKIGKIYVEHDTEFIENMTKDNVSHEAVTLVGAFYETSVGFAIIKFRKNAEKPHLLMTHEMGHALGFGHTEENCTGYVMNKWLDKMGNQF